MAIEIERGSGPMNTRPDPAIGQDASVDAAEAPVPPKRPFRYSLRGLMLLVTLTGPFIAAATGALGELTQATIFTILFLLMYATFTAGFFLLVSYPVFWLLSWIEDSRSARHAPPPER